MQRLLSSCTRSLPLFSLLFFLGLLPEPSLLSPPAEAVGNNSARDMPPNPEVLSQEILNPTIEVGIIQRFGEKTSAKINLQAPVGDRLTLKFVDQQTQPPMINTPTTSTSGSIPGAVEPVNPESENSTPTNPVLTLQVQKLKLEIQAQPLPEPQVQERVVLSIHRSFESAETTAQYWRQRGIAIEIAQPGKWQVWADRQRYNTSELRQQLLQELQTQGLTTAHLDRQTLIQVPQATWVVNGRRYSSDHLKISAGKGLMQVNGESFVGELRLQPNTYGTYTLVNRVPVETYLRGVVPYEIGPAAPTTAVQAQAIIARTYALRNLRRFEADDYQLCADTQCQVYRGLEGSNPRVDQAIAATAGQVLTYGRELVDALYSSTTGGVTAAFEDVWEGQSRPYLQAVVDAVPNQVWNLQQRSLAKEANFRAFINLRQGFNEQTWRYFRWKQDASLQDLNKDLRTFLRQKQSPLASFKTIEALNVLERAESGRVQKLEVTTNLGAIVLTKDEILRCFYAPNSLLFYLEPRYKLETGIKPGGSTRAKPQVLAGYRFIGGGLGHAVGLSQTGSYHLAELGWSAERILGFYYPGTRLQPLNNSVIFWQDPQALKAGVEAHLIFNPVFALPVVGAPLEQLWQWWSGG